jgi:hypothetical protein
VQKISPRNQPRTSDINLANLAHFTRFNVTHLVTCHILVSQARNTVRFESLSLDNGMMRQQRNKEITSHRLRRQELKELTVTRIPAELTFWERKRSALAIKYNRLTLDRLLSSLSS